jgi:phage shock protein C
MYCNSCGQSIADDAHFCSHCGNTVGNTRAEKRLIRSRSDRKIAGVCAGMGQYLDLDISLVRILWVLVTFAVGFFPGLIAYIVAWIIVPEESEFHPVIAAGQPVAS